MFYSILKKSLFLHMLAGVASGIVIFVLLTLGKYDKNLAQELKMVEAARVNVQKMRSEIAQIDALKRKIDLMLPSGYSSKSHKETMLLTLDNIKDNIAGSEIKIENFEEKGGDLSLHADIVVPASDWRSLVNALKFLQLMKFPYFDIKNVVVEAKDAHPVCRIDGALKMSSGSLK